MYLIQLVLLIDGFNPLISVLFSDVVKPEAAYIISSS